MINPTSLFSAPPPPLHSSSSSAAYCSRPLTLSRLPRVSPSGYTSLQCVSNHQPVRSLLVTCAIASHSWLTPSLHYLRSLEASPVRQSFRLSSPSLPLSHEKMSLLPEGTRDPFPKPLFPRCPSASGQYQKCFYFPLIF